MAKAKRRKSNYKFTEKTQSKRGICGFVLSLISLGIFAYVVVNSFRNRGAGSMYLGSAGVTSMILAFVALAISIISLKEEESFKLFPTLGTVTSVLAAGTWISIYVIGFTLV